jgi:HEAT repeat protein
MRALHRIAGSADAPTPPDINALSMPTRENIEEFKQEWPKIAPERQRAIVRAMNESAELSVQFEFTDLLIPLLDDPDEYVRAGAIDGLWENEIPSVGRRLVRLVMEDPSAQVRSAAADGLGHFLLRAEMGKLANPSSATITEALLTRLNDEDEDDEVRRRALESIAYSGDPRISEVIRQAYSDGDQSMRVSAVFAMGRSADTAWSDIVVRELRSKDAAMRYEAAFAAGELTVSEALPRLIELVQDEDLQVRESAVYALGQIGGREARRVLEMVLESDEEALHEAAEDAMAELEFAEGDTQFSLFDFEMPDGGNGNGHVTDDEAEEAEDDE